MKSYQELRNAVEASGGTLTVSGNTLGARVSELLSTVNQDQPLVLTGLVPGPGDGENETVVLTGQGSFLQMPDLPVTARFSLDGEGNVRMLLKYRLRDAAPGPSAWTFSRSFPTLPTVWNYGTAIPDPHLNDPSVYPAQRPYVDALELFDSAYVVTTHAGVESETHVPLVPGINFVSKMRPQGTLGVLEYALAEGKPLTVYGPIRVPRATDRTLPLVLWERPWNREDAPGIQLRAPLNLDFKAGKLVFEQAALRIYTPPSSEWLEQNGTFVPLHGYTGRLSVPSANLQVDLTADLEWGLSRALLYARCEGVTLGKLGQLADLAGTDALSAVLPEALRDAANKLDKLALLDVSLNLQLKNKVPTVDGVSFTVGMPGLTWKVWDDHLAVRDLACRFEVQGSPGTKTSLAVTLMGTLDIEGVPVSVMARSAGGFTLYAKLDGARTIPLEKLMKTYAPGLPPPSDLTVKTLALSLSPGRSYSMATQLAGSPKPWVVPLGRSNITINDVSLNLASNKGGQTTGAFAGTASFGKALTLSVGYSLPGDFAIRGVFPKVNLTQLVEELCEQKVPMPGGFDLVLENAAVLIQKQNDSYTFRAATSVKDFGLLAFEVRKIPGRGWGFATGMDLGSAGLSKLPGLGALKSIEDSFKLQKLMLVLSSFEDAGFTFPDMAQFNQPRLGAGKLAMPAQASGVIPGLMLFAEWKLDDSSRELKLLKSLLGLGDTQSATVAIGADPAKDFRLYVSQKSTLQKQPFQCRFGMELVQGKPSFFLTGSLTTKIQGQAQTFDLTTTFVPGGAFMSATAKGGTAINCGPFKLSNLALQMGVNWAGIPSLGIAATIDVKNFQSSLAVFFDSTDPSRSLVAGSISSLTAKDVLDTLVGGNLKTPLDEVLGSIAIKGTHEFSLPGDVGDALDGLDFARVSTAFASAKVTIPSSSQQLTLVVNTKGSSWHLTDLGTMRHYELAKQGDKVQVRIAPQFYFAPQPTSIGTLKYPQGYYVNAAISFCGFDAAATIDIAQNKGFSVDAQMDKIVLVDEKLFSLAAAQGGGGPKVSISTFSQPENPVAEFRLPHFYVNGSLTMMGLKRSVFASVSVNGIDFELKGPLMPGVYFDVDARFGKSGLDAGGLVKVGVGTIDLGPLGKAKINTELEAELDIELNGKNIDISLKSRFQFAGQMIDIAKFKLDATPDALTRLPEVMSKKVEAALRDVFKDATKWANAVSDGVMDGVNDTEKVFKDVYKKSEKEAKELAKGINKGVNQAGKAIENTAKDTGKAIENTAKDMGKGVSKTTKKVGKAFKKLF